MANRNQEQGPAEAELGIVVELVDRFLAEAEKKQPGVSGKARSMLAELGPKPGEMPAPETVQATVERLRAEIQAAQAELLDADLPLPSGLSTAGLPEVVEEFSQKLQAQDGEGIDALIQKMEQRFAGLLGTSEREAQRDRELTDSVRDSIGKSLLAHGIKPLSG